MSTTLKAKDGYTYTNGTIFSKVVYLSDIDSADNWHEVAEKEAQEKMQHIEPTSIIESYEQALTKANSLLSEQADINAQQDDMITELYESLLGGTEE